MEHFTKSGFPSWIAIRKTNLKCDNFCVGGNSEEFPPFLNNTYWKPMKYIPAICGWVFSELFYFGVFMRRQIQASTAIKESKQFHSQPCQTADGVATNMHRICCWKIPFAKMGTVKVIYYIQLCNSFNRT